MKTLRLAWTLAVASFAAASIAMAQTPPSQGNGTSPSSASSPHQRAATSNAAPASPITGDPQDKTSRPRSPTDSEVLAQCIAREQADHTGMSAKEAASACRQQLTPKRPPK